MSTITHEPTRLALERLLEVASHDTGQSGRCASFLLAWWNARTCGGFDLTDLWSMDDALMRDMLQVIAYVATNRQYPSDLGYSPQFDHLIRHWRPKLLKPKKERILRARR